MGVLIFQLLINSIVAASLFALSGVSWGIIYSTTRTFHFSHSLVFTVAGYAAVLLTSQTKLPYSLGLLAAVSSAVILGCSIDTWLYRRLRSKGATQATIFLSSLGLATAGMALILLFFSSNPRPLKGFPVIDLSIEGGGFTTADLLMVTVSWLMIGFLILFLKKTNLGKAIRAVASNSEMAKNVGIDINRTYSLVFGIGSGLFGIASFLFAVKYVASPTMGMYPFVMAFTCVFLGGVHSIPGIVLAGTLLGFAENFGMILLPGEYKIMITYAILFVVILVRPEGLAGKKQR
jgi:branched-chain amino acid transport system permease protein